MEQYQKNTRRQMRPQKIANWLVCVILAISFCSGCNSKNSNLLSEECDLSNEIYHLEQEVKSSNYGKKEDKMTDIEEIKNFIVNAD